MAVLPSGYVKIAIENDPVEIVDVPIENGGFSHQFFVCLPGRVHHGKHPIGDDVCPKTWPTGTSPSCFLVGKSSPQAMKFSQMSGYSHTLDHKTLFR